MSQLQDTDKLPAWLQQALVDKELEVVYTGQSNCTSLGALSGMVSNPNIYDLRATTPPDTGPYIFKEADPNYESQMGTASPNNDNVFTGMSGNYPALGSPASNAGWWFCDTIQRLFPVLTVYMVTVHRVGTPISYWLSGGGCEVDLNTAMSTAHAINGRSYPHVIIFDQGDNDRSRAAADYVTDGETMKALYEATWASSSGSPVQYAHWISLEYGQGYLAYWAGQEDLATAIGAEFVGSKGLVVPDTIHFDGLSQKRRGQTAAYRAIAGISAPGDSVFGLATFEMTTSTTYEMGLGTELDLPADSNPSVRVTSEDQPVTVSCAFAPMSDTNSVFMEAYVRKYRSDEVYVLHNDRYYRGYMENIRKTASNGLNNWSLDIKGVAI